MNGDDRNEMSRPLTRDERLAAKLRENLRRRKAQARLMGGPQGDSPALPKQDGKS